MIDEKRITEIVRILRRYGTGDALLHHHEVQPLAKDAADIIESLQSQLAEKDKFFDEWASGEDQHQQVVCQLDCARIRIESLQSQFTECKEGLSMFSAELDSVSMENIRLHDALAASQAKERAAVEELKEVVTASERLCKWCRFRGEKQRCASCWWYTGRIENEMLRIHTGIWDNIVAGFYDRELKILFMNDSYDVAKIILIF